MDSDERAFLLEIVDEQGQYYRGWWRPDRESVWQVAWETTIFGVPGAWPPHLLPGGFHTPHSPTPDLHDLSPVESYEVRRTTGLTGVRQIQVTTDQEGRRLCLVEGKDKQGEPCRGWWRPGIEPAWQVAWEQPPHGPLAGWPAHLQPNGFADERVSGPGSADLNSVEQFQLTQATGCKTIKLKSMTTDGQGQRICLLEAGNAEGRLHRGWWRPGVESAWQIRWEAEPHGALAGWPAHLQPGGCTDERVSGPANDGLNTIERYQLRHSTGLAAVKSCQVTEDEHNNRLYLLEVANGGTQKYRGWWRPGVEPVWQISWESQHYGPLGDWPAHLKPGGHYEERVAGPNAGQLNPLEQNQLRRVTGAAIISETMERLQAPPKVASIDAESQGTTGESEKKPTRKRSEVDYYTPYREVMNLPEADTEVPQDTEEVEEKLEEENLQEQRRRARYDDGIIMI